MYLWDLEDSGFAGVVLLKKSMYLFLLLPPSLEIHLSGLISDDVLIRSSLITSIRRRTGRFMGFDSRFRDYRTRAFGSLQADEYDHATANH